jgi:hypothetical protein
MQMRSQEHRRGTRGLTSFRRARSPRHRGRPRQRAALGTRRRHIAGHQGDDRVFAAARDTVTAAPATTAISAAAATTTSAATQPRRRPTSFDRLFGGAGDDTLRGGDSRDRMHGGSGNDTAFGEAGRDVLFGHRGDDRLFGGGGDDVIFGGPGADTVDGGAGDDRIRTRGRVVDAVTCGEGNDRAILDKVDVIADASAGNPNGSCEQVTRRNPR